MTAGSKQISSITKLAPVLFSVLFSVFLASSAAADPSNSKTSFGVPVLEDDAVYDQYVRQSIYVDMDDGVPLAVDIFLPAVGGKAVSGPLPTIFYYGRYWRAKELPDGTIVTNLGEWRQGQTVGELKHRDGNGRLLFWDTGRESIVDLMRHGYAFVRAVSRGAGASGGIRDGEHTLTEAKDGAELIGWIANQPWSDGNVGMIGGSYPGMTQLKVAALAPPALKAIFPAVPAFDLFQLASGGTGILHKGMLAFGEGQAAKDGLTEGVQEYKVAAVDADSTRNRLEEILRKRKANSPSNALFETLKDTAPEIAYSVLTLSKALGHTDPVDSVRLLMSPPHLARALEGKPELQAQLAKGLHLFRDTPAFSRERDRGMVSPHAVIDQINAAGIPVYIWSGWYDQDTIGATDLFQSLTVPKRLTVGTWSHGPNEDNGIDDHLFDAYEAQARELLNTEAIRWFDYWLKGRDNGIMAEPAVHYSVALSPTRLAWRESESWPVSGTTDTVFQLVPTGPAQSRDGFLEEAEQAESSVSFTVDYTKTMGPQTRVHDSTSGVPAMRYPDLNAHASGEGALTFETKALAEDTLLVGKPRLTLFAKSTAEDGDLFAYLEEVDSAGNAIYLTEGVIRASHGAVGEVAYNSGGYQYSRSDRKSVASAKLFNASIQELTVTFQPTANLFEKGHKIRLVITGGDMHNYLTPVFVPAPSITVYTGGGTPSALTLPTE